MAEQLTTIPITCCIDGQAHDVTDRSVAAGQRIGQYQALCGYLVLPAAMATPVGPPCVTCDAIMGMARPTTGRARRSHSAQPGWLRRSLRRGTSARGMR